MRTPALPLRLLLLLLGGLCGAASGQSCLGFADSRSVVLQLQAIQEGYNVTGLIETSLSCCGGGSFDVTGVECADTHCGTPRAVACPGNLQAYSLDGCSRKPTPPTCGDGEALIEAVCLGCGSSGCANSLDECYPCASGRAGTGGTCSACAAGRAPNAVKTACVICSVLAGAGYIGDGHTCTACARGTAPNAVEDACGGCAAGLQSGNGVTCQSCPNGEVPNSLGTGCTGCAAGSYADLSTYVCADCPTGTYSRPRAAVCLVCGDGYEADSMGVGCVQCGAGQAGLTGTCAACADGWAPEVMYGSVACVDCATLGDARYSDTTQCTDCSAGREVSVARTQCDLCPTGQVSTDGSQCAACNPGYVPTRQVEAYDCYSCVAGQYASTTTHLCEDCAAGTFSLQESPACYQCDYGYGVNPVGAGCVDCAAGEASSVGICQACSPGTAPTTARDVCEACDTFGEAYAARTNPGSGRCERCPAGSSPNTTRDACLDCIPGRASADGSPCALCSDGSAPDEARALCVACSGGRYSMQDAVRCEACPVGKFAAEGTALSCGWCGHGREPSADQFECVACASGTAGLSGNCPACALGRAPNTARTVCALCSVGQYSTGAQCTSCWPGTQPNAVGDDCEVCAYGKHSTQGHPCAQCAPGGVPNGFEGATACTTCRAGRYSDDVTFMCQACAPDTYAPLSSDECLRCGDGYGPDTRVAACEQCSPGRAGTNSTCKECERGNAPSENRTYCEACEAAPGGYADATLNRCAVCDAGRAPSIRRDFCMDCTFGLYRSSGAGMDNCSKCGPGFEPDRFAAASRCLSCMDGYISSGDICLRCMDDSAPDAEMSECVCKAGYQMNDRRSSCNDVDECGAVGNKGTCSLELNITVNCCSQFSGCDNYAGGFECVPCMAGFIGDGYGLHGCIFASSAGKEGSRAEAPEPYLTLRIQASEAVLEEGSDDQLDFMRLVAAEVATVLVISRDFIEVTELVASGDVSGAASTECQLTLTTDYASLPSLPVFEADVVSKLATLLAVDSSRIELTGVYAGSTVVKFVLHDPQPSDDGTAAVNRTDTVADLLTRLETVADPANWRSGDAIRDFFSTYESYDGGSVAGIVDVTFKIGSGATADDDRTVVDLLYSLNDAVNTGSLGALRLPSGQDVFDSLVLSCPPGTYQEPTEGCVACPPGSQPTEEQTACIACAAWATLPNSSSVFSVDGRGCELCPAGRSPDATRIECKHCTPGKAANGLGAVCSACQDRTMVPALGGVRCMCANGTVDTIRLSGFDRQGVSTKHVLGRCIPCTSGYASDITQSSCVKCESGKAKNGEEGVCINCEDAGMQATTDGTLCLPCDGWLTQAGESACRASTLGMFFFVVLVLGLGGAAATAGLRHWLQKTGKSKYGLSSVFAVQKYALQQAGGDLSGVDPSLAAAVMQDQLEQSAKVRKHSEKEAKRAEKEAERMLKLEEKGAAKAAKEEARQLQELEETKVFAESGTMVTPRLEHGEDYYEQMEAQRLAEVPNSLDKNEKWQTWLQRYIDPELEVDDYLGTLDMPEGWQPRGAARLAEEPEPEPPPPPPPPMADGASPPRKARAARHAGESSSGEEEDSSAWYEQRPGDETICGSHDPMLVPGAMQDTEALITATAERERAAKADRDRLKAEKLASWKQDRHQVVSMPSSLTSALGAHRPVSASFARVDPNFAHDGHQKAADDPLAHLRFRGGESLPRMGSPPRGRAVSPSQKDPTAAEALEEALGVQHPPLYPSA